MKPLLSDHIQPTPSDVSTNIALLISKTAFSATPDGSHALVRSSFKRLIRINFGEDDPSNVAVYIPLEALRKTGKEKSVSEEELSPNEIFIPFE